MTSNFAHRITIVCPVSLIDTLASAVPCVINEANWQDGHGGQFAVASLIAEESFDLSDVDALVCETHNSVDVLALAPDRILLVLGVSGVVVLEALQLSPVLRRL